MHRKEFMYAKENDLGTHFEYSKDEGSTETESGVPPMEQATVLTLRLGETLD